VLISGSSFSKTDWYCQCQNTARITVKKEHSSLINFLLVGGIQTTAFALGFSFLYYAKNIHTTVE
jgi:hypothetical protein